MALVQRDMVSDILERIWGDNYNQFFKFLGTKEGINWWIDIFDASSSIEKSFVHPEHVSTFSEMLRSKYLEDY